MTHLIPNKYKAPIAYGIVGAGIAGLLVAIRRIKQTPAPVTGRNVVAAVTGSATLPDQAGGG